MFGRKKVTVPDGGAVLHAYGVEGLTLNGKSIKDLPHKGGMLGGYTIPLEPGEYVAVGTYSMTSSAGRVNNKFKNISLTFPLRAGHDYDLGTYTDERELVEAIAYVELEKSGWFVACMINQA